MNARSRRSASPKTQTDAENGLGDDIWLLKFSVFATHDAKRPPYERHGRAQGERDPEQPLDLQTELE
jgi:hypothetical protein